MISFRAELDYDIFITGSNSSTAISKYLKSEGCAVSLEREMMYVQVCYLLASEETVQREFGAYHGIQDNFPKYVVSLDGFDMSRDGIKHRNIRDFLLAEEWN